MLWFKLEHFSVEKIKEIYGKMGENQAYDKNDWETILAQAWNVLSHKNYWGTIEYSEEDKCYFGKVAEKIYKMITGEVE